jgi:hypothetical protein
VAKSLDDPAGIRRIYPNNMAKRRIRSLSLILSTLIAATAVAQTPTTKLPLLGDLDRHLTDQNVADITRLVPAREAPFALIGRIGQKSIQKVAVLLQPSNTSSEVRRGAAIMVERQSANASWSLIAPIDYPAEYSTTFAQVDMSPPFFLGGQFSDTDLTGIASYIRSKPVIPNTRGKSIAAGPIAFIYRQSNDVFDVWLAERTAYQIVSIRRSHTWIVERTAAFGF